MGCRSTLECADTGQLRELLLKGPANGPGAQLKSANGMCCTQIGYQDVELVAEGLNNRHCSTDAKPTESQCWDVVASAQLFLCMQHDQRRCLGMFGS